MEPDASSLLHEYEEAEADLRSFIEANPELIAIQHRLVMRRNTALERLHKLARSRQVSIGPVQIAGSTSRVDAEKLAQVIGEARFAQIGGHIESKHVISIADLRKAVASGKVESTEANQAIDVSARFTCPDSLDVPGGNP